jgi:hypothetical protein
MRPQQASFKDPGLHLGYYLLANLFHFSPVFVGLLFKSSECPPHLFANPF